MKPSSSLLWTLSSQSIVTAKIIKTIHERLPSADVEVRPGATRVESTYSFPEKTAALTIFLPI